MLDGIIAPLDGQGFFTWELLYGEDPILAPDEELPEPTYAIRSTTQCSRMSIIKHHRRVMAICTAVDEPPQVVQQHRLHYDGREEV